MNAHTRPINIPPDAVNLHRLFVDDPRAQELERRGILCPVWFDAGAAQYFQQGNAHRGAAGTVACESLLFAIKTATSRAPLHDESEDFRIIRSRAVHLAGGVVETCVRVDALPVPEDPTDCTYLISVQHEPALRETASAN